VRNPNVGCGRLIHRISMKSKTLKRMRAACRTNDAQASSVGMMTCLMVLAALIRDGPLNWPILIFAVMFWPTLAFIFNLIDPLE